jgi:hypothetical protein
LEIFGVNFGLFIGISFLSNAEIFALIIEIIAILRQKDNNNNDTVYPIIK